MSHIDLLGYIAAFCTTSAFVPQLLRVVQTRSTRDISTGMFLLFCVGVVLWLFYGLLLHSTPIIVANAATLMLAGTILGLKLGYEGFRSASTSPDQPAQDR